MGRSKLKKKLQQEKPTAKETKESTSAKVPIDNLPEKFLWMHVSPRKSFRIRYMKCYSILFIHLSTLKGKERYQNQKRS